MKEGGVFGVPGGDITVEVPDGVTKTFGVGEARNSLTNSGFAHGGPDGCGYGAFPNEDGDFYPRRYDDRFRVG